LFPIEWNPSIIKDPPIQIPILKLEIIADIPLFCKTSGKNSNGPLKIGVEVEKKESEKI
jgi:hypothetical protein